MITKQIAGLLYSFSYKLQDNEGNVWDINSIIGESYFCCWFGDRNKNVAFEKIGSTYKILAREMDLTKPIEGVGIPILELAKIAFTDEKFVIEKRGKNVVSCMDFDFGYKDGYFRASSYAFRDVLIKNQLALFNWLYTHHFNFFPEGTTTNLI